MEFSYTESTDTSTNMVTKNYSKSRMRENCKYGSVRGGQSNLIPSTRLKGFRGLWWPLRGSYKRGAPDGAGCVEGLCSLSSGGDSGFAAEGKVAASPQYIAPFHRQKSCRGLLSRALV